MKRIDYHIHSSYSPDSESPMLSIAHEAISKGIKEIAMTDHFEPTFKHDMHLNYKPVEQRSELEQLRSQLGGKLVVLQGIEVGQPHRFPKLTSEVLSRVDYDYVIGSAHRGDNDVDVGMIHYTEQNVETVCRTYLNELLALVRHNCFDCLGHLDLVKRYASRANIAVSLEKYRDQIEEIFEILIANGKGIEVNTSGLREGINKLMPDYELVKIYYELGGSIITVGSDAHRVHHVGEGIDDALEMLKKVGFRYIAVYRGRQVYFTPIVYKPKYYNFTT